MPKRSLKEFNKTSGTSRRTTSLILISLQESDRLLVLQCILPFYAKKISLWTTILIFVSQLLNSLETSSRFGSSWKQELLASKEYRIYWNRKRLMWQLSWDKCLVQEKQSLRKMNGFALRLKWRFNFGHHNLRHITTLWLIKIQDHSVSWTWEKERLKSSFL